MLEIHKNNIRVRMAVGLCWNGSRIVLEWFYLCANALFVLPDYNERRFRISLFVVDWRLYLKIVSASGIKEIYIDRE